MNPMFRYPLFVLSLALAFTFVVNTSLIRAQTARSFVGKKPGQEWDDSGLTMKFCCVRRGSSPWAAPRTV